MIELRLILSFCLYNLQSPWDMWKLLIEILKFLLSLNSAVINLTTGISTPYFCDLESPVMYNYGLNSGIPSFLFLISQMSPMLCKAVLLYLYYTT